MANPIRRLVQLVFDQNAAKKAETDAKGSLNRIGGAVQSLKSAALRLGAAMAAAFTVRKLYQFGRDSVRVAAEADEIWTRLAGTVNNAGESFEAMEPRIRNMARAMQDATTVGDEEFAATFQELLSTSQDVEGSLQNVSVAADLAAAKNIDLRTAAQLVGRAMVGQTSTLTRYGIIIEEGADAVEVLREQFRGMAENEAQSLGGQIKQLGNEWGDFKQAVGNAIIEAGNGVSVIQSLTAAVRTAAEWIDENRQAIAIWGRVAIETIRTVVAAAVAVIRIPFNLGQTIGRSIDSAFLSVKQGVAQTVNFIIDGLNLLPGVDIEFRMNELTPEEFRRQQKELTDGIIQDYKDMGDAIADVGRGVLGIASAATGGGSGRNVRGRDVTTSIATREGRTAPTPGGGLSEEELKEQNRLLQEAARITESLRTKQEVYDDTVATLDAHLAAGRITQETYNRGLAEAKKILEETVDPADKVTEALRRHSETLATIATMETALGDEFDALDAEARSIESTLYALADAGVPATDEAFAGLVTRLGEVRDAMSAATAESEVLGEVASAVGDVVGAAFGGGIGRLAEGKARQNAILAAEQLAHGFAALTNPFTAATAGGHFAAAAKYTAIAAAWKALGASVGGGGGGGGFRGSGGAPGVGGRDFGGLQSEGFDPTAPEVHIHFSGEGFNAVNPTVQRVVAGAMQMVGERYGENARVRIHRREGG